MNSVELAGKIQLHPRAVVLMGTLETRMKNQGSLPGLTPHYARTGCPVVQYAGANAVEEPSAAEIEVNLQETGFPLPAALEGYSVRQGNLVQLMYGRNGQAPTQGAYRVLREAAGVLNQVASSRREVFLVTLPILTPGQMGVTSGRHYFLAAFNTDGVAIYLNPDAAKSGVLKAEYPPHQKERSTGQIQQHDHWYKGLADVLATTGLKGNGLHDAVLKARAQQLVDRGSAPTLAAGLALATSEAPKAQGQGKDPAGTAAPAKEAHTARQLGAKLRGRSLADIADKATPKTTRGR